MKNLPMFWLAAMIALGSAPALGHGDEKEPASVEEFIKGASAFNGQRIFIEGVNRLGEPIPFRGGGPTGFSCTAAPASPATVPGARAGSCPTCARWKPRP